MNRRFIRLRRGTSLLVLIVVSLIGFASSASAQEEPADLSVIKNGAATIVAGTDVTYTIIVSHVSGGSSIPTNTLTDVLPAGMTFVSEEHPDGWSCTTPALGATGTITCTYENPITEETTFTFTFVFHLDSGVVNGTEISNTASISHEGADPNSNNDSSTSSATVGPAPPPAVTQHDVLISEFRLSGPGGNSDEFVEFYCNRDQDCDISSFAIRAHDPDPNVGDFTFTFPPNTIIPARQYLLVADLSGYSLLDYGFPDFDVSNPSFPDFFMDNQGVQLVSAGDPFIIDSVGFNGGGNAELYIEGTGLQPAVSRPADQYAYVRKRTLATAGLPQDTDNNAEDFVLVSVTGATHFGVGVPPPVLGAPGPQGLTSALSYSNTQILPSLVEPLADVQTAPNRVRTGSGNSGTISFRRSFTNNTNETFSYLAFRVIEITTLNSPSISPDQAELRLITSENAETFTNSQGRTVIIRGTILEYDAGCGCEPQQPNGGGLNTTVFVNLSDPETEEPIFIAPGETVDVQFLLNVVADGFYRFYVYSEAFSEQLEGAPLTKATRKDRVAYASRTKPPRKLVRLKRGPKPIGAFGKKPLPIISPTKVVRTVQPGTAIPVRAWITMRMPAANSTRKRKKTRVRRKAATALRMTARPKDADEKAPQD